MRTRFLRGLGVGEPFLGLLKLVFQDAVLHLERLDFLLTFKESLLELLDFGLGLLRSERRVVRLGAERLKALRVDAERD